MNESVWFEQVDIALVRLLKHTIQVDGKPVKVVVRKPDEDFNEEDYPLVSITNLFDTFATHRYSPEPVVVSREEEFNQLVTEESALPHDLHYQIDFWSTLQTDINSMTKQWKTFAKRWFNLSVFDESGTERSCFVLLKNDFRRADLVKEGKRLFHGFESLKIQVELDDRVKTTVPMVTQPVEVKTERV